MPLPPASMEISSVDTTEVQLSWKPSNGEYRYVFELEFAQHIVLAAPLKCMNRFTVVNWQSGCFLFRDSPDRGRQDVVACVDAPACKSNGALDIIFPAFQGLDIIVSMLKMRMENF